MLIKADSRRSVLGNNPITFTFLLVVAPLFPVHSNQGRKMATGHMNLATLLLFGLLYVSQLQVAQLSHDLCPYCFESHHLALLLCFVFPFMILEQVIVVRLDPKQENLHSSISSQNNSCKTNKIQGTHAKVREKREDADCPYILRLIINVRYRNTCIFIPQKNIVKFHSP